MSVVASGAGLDGVAVEERIARLEHDFGDLDDPGNPLGAEQFAAADAERRILPAAERLLDDFRLNAEFVPRELGGRLLQLDSLARVMRAVFRRDASLGLGYGMSSYMAAVVVWAGGSAEQRRDTAELLLSGGRMACAYPEPAEGNDFLQNRFIAAPNGDAFLLSGRKEALNNASRATSLLLFAHSAEDSGDGHSAFLFGAPKPGSAGFRLLPRRSTIGIRGCLVHGLEFTRYGLTADQLLGPPHTGAELAARAFPVIRCVGPSMALGSADTALRTAVAFARSHRSRSRASLRMPRTRTALVDAFTDLLLCDALALVATRALHLLPRESPTLSAVVKYLLPTVLTEMVYDLSIVLGSESYARQGTYAAFQKSARDLPMIGLGPVGSTASRAAIVAHLGRLPGLRAPVDGEVPAALFRPLDPELPGLRQQELSLPADMDSLVGTLESTVRQASAAGGGELEESLAGYAAALGAELARFRRACAELANRHDGHAGLRVYALADRYALIAAGAACLGVWRHHSGSPGDFLADPAWAVMALSRVLRRLDPGTPGPPRLGEERLLAELVHRFDDARSYDLYSTLIGR
ncbi:acyl-CoA dehydrogenase family protein [Streptomyces capitiformicae]|uniref:Acyl-CoA dehydrogenase n=1 Tax=Streptomyces capitiformicae TaxID=2014920 RepID=A0A918ZIY8_9ACTN|nr:acyl-CoA dehydrogenase family protein [Streptomyces capitiformicae]GHE55483.1 acyl-CoA dehydrogenase [Streptomyces capitiformicae]